MADGQVWEAGTRQERRKAATRAKIQAAAEQLFGERGYAATSIEDISETADVAVRTIYMHFPSKAAIMLAYFDDWVTAFIEEILRRPVDEPVVETVREALREMSEAGWVDRIDNQDSRVHPIAEHLQSGTPDIAGHVLQRWMREMDRLAEDVAQRGGYAAGSLEPRARAVAVFSAWIAAISSARERDSRRGLRRRTRNGGAGNGRTKNGRTKNGRATNDSPGLDILGLITGGGL